VAATEVKNLHRDGRFYIAGAPTRRGLEDLKAEGVRMVIDLRQPAEGTDAEASIARELGMAYTNIPMKSDTLTDEQAERILLAMKSAGDGPVLIHCAAGNRAGAAYGLFLGAGGSCPADEAIERAKRAGMKNPTLTEALRQRLARRGQ
jgi:uncharacterized protein (TIGR01244 family)